MALVTLKKRSEFLRVRGGSRWATSAFVLETKPRTSEQAETASGPRFGFTITKALGGAVVRNRIRRRLKAAIIEVSGSGSHANYDYVVVARAAALERPFPDLKKDLEQAFQRVHHPRQRRQPTGRPA